MGDRYVLVTIADNSITNYGNSVTIIPLADDIVTMAKETSTDLKESLDHYIWNTTTQKVDRLTQAAIDVIEAAKSSNTATRLTNYATITSNVPAWFDALDITTMISEADAVNHISLVPAFLKKLSYIVMRLRGYDD